MAMAKEIFAHTLRFFGAIVAIFGGLFFIISWVGYFTSGLSEAGEGVGSAMDGFVLQVSLFCIFIFGLLCYWISAKLLGVSLIRDKNSGHVIHMWRVLAILALPILVFLYIFGRGYNFI
jgi:hypothetical protein